MRLILLTMLTLLAFAANSVLTRAAIEGGHMDPGGFTIVRVFSGAVMLGLLVALRARPLPLLRRSRLLGALSLAVYMTGFSLAYRTLDAGLGALILFGATQITMFAHAGFTGSAPNGRQLTGAGVAFCGLAVVLWPGPHSVTDPAAAALMVLAGAGWGVYTIAGRTAAEPLTATAANFILCLPLLSLMLVGAKASWTPIGVALAVLCGAVTSGLGYALWYTILPHIRSTTAAVVQLAVPVLAILGGALVLGETVTPLVVLAAAMVLGGIGWAVTAKR